MNQDPEGSSWLDCDGVLGFPATVKDGVFQPKQYFAVLSAQHLVPALSTRMELSTDRVHTGISSLREDYANEAADVTSSSSALGLLAVRKPLHGVYCHPKSPELVTGFSRSCWDSQQLLLKPSE